MIEPTREQIREAFKKTIKRWEKMVEEPNYFYESDCELCLLESVKRQCNSSCPIRHYQGEYHGGCVNTPYGVFYRQRTPENALAELNFLREVYMWWLEKEVDKIFEKYGIDDLKEEKKEQWQDITDRVYCFLHRHVDDYDVHFSESTSEDVNEAIGWMYADGKVEVRNEVKLIYKIEKSDLGEGRLLKIFKKITL